MKLKKAMREYARAVDNLACIVEHKRHTDDLLWFDSAIDTDLAMARKEKQRTVRQMNAVMVAMQYRGANKIWTPPQKREIVRLEVPGDIVNAAARAVLMGCTDAALLRYQNGVRLGGFTFDEAISRRVKMFQYEDANGIRSRHKYVNAYD